MFYYQSLVFNPPIKYQELNLKYQVLTNLKAALCFCENLNLLMECLFLDKLQLGKQFLTLHQ